MKKLNVKRMVSIMLACLMVIPMLMFGTISATAASEVLYTCTFEGIVTEDDPTTDKLENRAGRANNNMSGNFGWTSWENNINIGYFHYDSLTDRNYLEVKDSNAGKGAFSIASSPIVAGKVYVSFSYRRPDGAEYPVYLRVTDGTDKFQLARVGDNVGLCESMLAESSTTVGELADGNWHEVGFIFDMDAKTLTGYADGIATEKVLELPETLDGIQQLGLAINNNNVSLGDIADILVKKVTGTNEITANTEVGENEIKVAFNETLGTVITADKVKVELCGSDSELTVTGVKQVGSILDISYEGTPVAGREYRISYGDVKTAFGNDVAPVYFYVPAVSNVTGITGATNPSVVNADGVIDFEDLTFAEDTTAKYKPIKVTDPTDFYTYFGTRNTDRANVNIVTVESIGVTNGNSSTYALEGKNTSFNLAFGEKLIQNDTRTVVYEFKYLYKKASTNAARVNLAVMNPNGTNNQHGRIVTIPLDATAWHTMKVVYDRVTPKIDVYRDNELLGSYTTYYNSGSKATEDLPSFVWRIGVDYMSAPMADVEFYIDDFKQSYVSASAGIESIRYVDINNKKSGLDTITPATKAIEIKFSEDMAESTLSEISVNDGVITDRSYNSATCTYTLALENLLTGNAEYTLTVPNTVTAVSGAKLKETVYSFSTTAGEFKLSNLKLETAGAELANVSAVAGSTITVKADMVNTIGKTGNVTLIYSFYDDDMLVDVNYETIPLTSGMATLSTKTFNVKSGIAPDSAKAFVWEGTIDALEPIIPATEY